MDYDRNNESATDFAYALALALRKYAKDEIIRRIMNERTDWNNHRGKKRTADYLERTVSKAMKIIRESSHKTRI